MRKQILIGNNIFSTEKQALSSEVDYITDESNNLIFKDKNLAESFRNYHREKPNLRIVRNEINLSRTGMARLKRSSKDLIIQ